MSTRKRFARRSRPGPLHSLHRRLFRRPSLSSLLSSSQRSPGRRLPLHGRASAISPRTPVIANRRRSQPPAASAGDPAAMRAALRLAPRAARAMRTVPAGQRVPQRTVMVSAPTPKVPPTEMASIRTATPARATAPTDCIRPRHPRRDLRATAIPRMEKLLPSPCGVPIPPARVRAPMRALKRVAAASRH